MYGDVDARLGGVSLSRCKGGRAKKDANVPTCGSVEADSIAEVHADIGQAGGDNAHDRNEPRRSTRCPLSHTEPAVKNIRLAQRGEIDARRVHGQLRESREEIEGEPHGRAEVTRTSPTREVLIFEIFVTKSSFW